MSDQALESKALIERYIHAFSGGSKTDEVVARFVDDPSLKEHIRQAEAAFPGYELVPAQLVAEGEFVAMRATFHGVHRGTFAGIEATGNSLTADVMLFYRVVGGRIVEHWMQLDMLTLLNQMKSEPPPAQSQPDPVHDLAAAHA